MNGTLRRDCEHSIIKWRNPRKKDYALAVLEWMEQNETGPEPNRNGLTVMGAQSVMHRLSELRTFYNFDRLKASLTQGGK